MNYRCFNFFVLLFSARGHWQILPGHRQDHRNGGPWHRGEGHVWGGRLSVRSGQGKARATGLRLMMSVMETVWQMLITCLKKLCQWSGTKTQLSFFFCNCIVLFGLLSQEIQVAFPGEGQLRQSHYTAYGACWMFLCFHSQPNSWHGHVCAQMLMHVTAHGGVWTP